MNSRTALLAVGLSLSVFASADFTFVDFFKVTQYQQTSNAAPVTPTSYYYNARIFTNNAFDATLGTLTYPDGSTATLTPSSPTLIEHGHSFATEAALDAATPTGTYTYSVDTGTLAGQIAQLNLGVASAYCNEVPYLTGTSYDALQHAHAGTDVSVTFDAFTNGNTFPNTFLSFFDVFDTTAGTFTVDLALANANQSVTLPGATLVAGHTYTYGLFFSSRQEPNGSLPTGTGLVGFDRLTVGQFTATPEPISLAVFGAGLLGLVARKRNQR